MILRRILFYLLDFGAWFCEKRNSTDSPEQTAAIRISLRALQFFPNSEKITEHQPLTPFPDIIRVNLHRTACTFQKLFRDRECGNMAQMPQSLRTEICIQMVLKLKGKAGIREQKR